MPAADARVTDALDAAVVRAWVRLAAGALARESGAINDVNVFPVADGDTGTNLSLTAREGARAVAGAQDDAGPAALLRRLARGALLGARGNSGVILSEWLRGLAVAATRGDTLARALDVAATSARAAVAHPHPGTILTAADVAAAAAHDTAARAGATVDDVLQAAVRGAREAALSSVAALAPLARAGVLDAGACGLVLVLDALRAARALARDRVLQAGPAQADAGGDGGGQGGAGRRGAAMSVATTTMLAVTPVTLGLDLTGHRTDAAAVGGLDAHPHDHEHSDADEVEVMFVLRRPAGATEFAPGEVAEALRRDLAAVGGSVVVVGGSGSGADGGGEDSAWQAHVHTPDLPAAITVARRWAERGVVEPLHVRHLAVPEGDLTVVAAMSAPALAVELARAGATVLVGVPPAGITARDLASAALETARRTSLVLGPDPAAVRAEVARLQAEPDGLREDALRGDSGLEVVVVDAPSDVHAAVVVAALAAAQDDPHADLADAAAFALAGLRTAEAAASGAVAALERLLEGGGEVVTALADDDVPAAVVEALEHTAAAHGAECVVLRTGRAGTRVGLGAEG